MEGLLELLYSIPVLGLVFQLFGYMVDLLPQMAPFILRAATPLAFGALCGVMCERSGVVNIAIEGTMLFGAFAGWIVSVAVAPTLASIALPIFGANLGLIVGVAGAVGVAMLVSLLLAWLAVSVRADQIISGTIINILAFGATGFLYSLIVTGGLTSSGSFTAFRPPRELIELPAVGWLIRAVLGQGPLTLVMLVSVVLVQVMLFRSRWGLRTRAVGEHPKAAETAGVDVIRVRYRNVLLGGAFAGLAGAYLSMEATNTFQDGMTAGRGFIALAAMIVGRWTPIGGFLAALLFSTSLVFGQAVTFAPPGGDLGAVLAQVPRQFYDVLPYVVTVIVLAGVVGRSIPPAADGRPYEREGAT
jgi:general nucleoside transport system permease protein